MYNAYPTPPYSRQPLVSCHHLQSNAFGEQQCISSSLSCHSEPANATALIQCEGVSETLSLGCSNFVMILGRSMTRSYIVCTPLLLSITGRYSTGHAKLPSHHNRRCCASNCDWFGGGCWCGWFGKCWSACGCWIGCGRIGCGCGFFRADAC